MVALATGLLLLGGIAILSLRSLYSPIPDLERPVVVEVERGSSLSRVADELHRAGRLPRPALFKLLARWRGVADSIRIGEYELEPGITPARLLDKMVAGDTVQYRVTLVEGWTFAQALEAIWQSEKIRRELDDYDPEQIADLLGLEAAHPEGMLFPDTYFYTRGASDVELLIRANRRLDELLREQWEQRLADLPYDDPFDALILASIIEKESAVGSERGHIAGVFVRRLESGMRLQSDPTVIYGMGDAYTGDIRRADLASETAYNTYRINGLPPTPIALAGLDSIRSSLNPLPSDYLYFVSRGDGSHQFSRSLEEHNEAVNRYQRRASQ